VVPKNHSRGAKVGRRALFLQIAGWTYTGVLPEVPSAPKVYGPKKGDVQMAATNLNRVIITGNLTRDPELRSLPSGTSVCSLRVAVNTRRKDQSTGDWVDKANYFDVTVWGAQGENCAQYLAKGRPVAVDGRLEWREWEDKQGNKRQSVDIIADSVQFLGSREGSENGGRFTPQSDVPADTGDFESAPAGAGGSDDDIPF
jgi:single-strand DNA-binding protein